MSVDKVSPSGDVQQASDATLDSPSGAGAASAKGRQSAPGHPSAQSTHSTVSPARGSAVNGLESQPMTATMSSSSEVAGNDPASNSNTPAPYGTRSRGRNGAPRPNYAEDRDIDMELELTSPAQKTGSSKRGATSGQITANGSPAAEQEKTPAGNTRRGQAPVNGTNGATNSKEAIPGTSTFSANPNAGNGGSTASRKRKQPASGTGSAPENTAGSSKKIFTTAPEGSRRANGSNMMTFETHGAYLKNGKLKADDGTVLAVNDHVYLICEPPGEPYYLARIMEFLPSKEDPSGPIEALRVNWYYRPRDIQRKVTDCRLVFASMHSDTCPLTSLRGKCQILHTSEIEDLDEYRKTKDTFWFDKMFDRYIHRYYEVIPTSKVINVPANVKKVLDERWRFVLVEVGRRKELTSAVKTCKRCNGYAASTDSVDCAVCKSTYHMYCVRPVLTKKPARGFAWACAACSRKHDQKLEARNTPSLGEGAGEAEEEILDEEEEDTQGAPNGTGVSTPAVAEESLPQPATSDQIAQSRMWPYRYLGIHCRVEDALDYDDRIYPRASSRLGPRHQANVGPWYGHPVEYVKPADVRKKYAKGAGRSTVKLSKDALAAIEAEKQERAKRPKWVMDEPTGYVRRGEDEPVTVAGKQVRTAELLWKMPEASQIPSRGEDDAPGSEMSLAEREKFVDDYMERAKEIAPEKGLEKYSTNFLDKALQLLYSESFNAEAALAKLKQVNKYTQLKEPHLRPEEVKVFEQGVAKYGSELRLVTKHVGTVPHYQIVRFYYMWKKTPRGQQIWGNYEGRRGRKAAKRADNSTAKLVDDVADDQDDSAFDSAKAVEKKRGFQCKFCNARNSRQWRRAPAVQPGTTVPAEPSSKRDKGSQLMVALCLQCAVVWRKYGLQWEDINEVSKKISQGGTKAWRRRVEEDLLSQLLVAIETPYELSPTTASAAAALGINVSTITPPAAPTEAPKKKAKTTDKDSAPSTGTSVEPAPKKKPAPEKAPEPPQIVPDPPKAKTLPCAICNKMDPMGDQHLSCRDCRLTVHRGCYGVSPTRNCTKWFCDMCLNDRNPMISTSYECVLCPVTWTEHELMEPPKSTHKKKTDREREKERLEKEMVAEAIKLYRQRQEAVGKPIGPREPLKRTAGNNWVHVMCAVWNPEIKFGNAKELEPAEGFGLIPADRYREVCRICKTNKGACVPCQFPGCNAQFHVGCAFQSEYTFGFDVTPVKSSRKDSINTIKLGEEVGSATAGIWCPGHALQTVVHEMSEPTDQENMNALQLFAQTYKQADLTLTGTVRKAAHVQQSVGASTQNGTTPGNRRASTANGTVVSLQKDGSKSSRTSPEEASDEMVIDSEGHTVSHPPAAAEADKKCFRCSTSVSPRWWPVENTLRGTVGRNGTPLMNGVTLSEPGDARYPSANSASPSFHTPSLSQSSLPRLNGDFSTPDKPVVGTPNDVHRAPAQSSAVSYECHKCHIKKPVVQSSPELRPSPFSSQGAPVLPAPRLAEYPPVYGQQSHHLQQGVLPRPIGASPHSAYPGYEQRPSEYGDPNLRNGIPPSGPQPNGLSGYHAPPPQHMNGYAAPPHHAPPPPPPPHYANGVPPPPPPHAYPPPHQSPYGPVAVPSPRPVHAPGPRPYGASASPPDVHATMVRHSPQHSLSGGPPRMYSVDRVLSAPAHSPSLRGSVDPQLPSTPGKPEDQANAQARPTSSSRYAGANGTSTASGASASPSLKNLLS
ncbi:putative PHD finger and BAH domain protein [Paecilomyces variotii]|uniref:Putative PHD finger and BAH domain protein n=1 Tax=Byssochlamys spectabilis TaxID=264951 RepID=A0A443HSP7_BYSSP|nr:putative PHD finger and BAH domain protein [Paecilomyces variotii]KAJ9231840.1 hypothetical protein DTO166G5_6543 [Paecilomyces variotii]KAJ9364584.1 hypothetical protein DTO280E4_1364 [Paecilomyces variotii]KAJ9372076.1 hypothetical protein DTO282E5_3169 [Paecilomyces variotii]RWQ94846.1 putative PHD finger and BAH domain protein [Paecilomyces variotii]